jgi:hypothetical protein
MEHCSVADCLSRAPVKIRTNNLSLLFMLYHYLETNEPADGPTNQCVYGLICIADGRNADI